jgi:hypothetical protein
MDNKISAWWDVAALGGSLLADAALSPLEATGGI